jgi:hypothetical protein
MASLDPTANEIIENLINAADDAVIDSGIVGGAPSSPPYGRDNISKPAEDAASAETQVDALPAAVAPVTPIKKRKPVDQQASMPPPAPKKAAAPARVATVSPLITQILAGLAQYPEEGFEEMTSLVRSLSIEYASYSLQRLIATYVKLIIGESGGQPNFYLHQLLLICFGYGSASEEARVILREVIKLPNFISKTSTLAPKQCKLLLGHAFVADQQPQVIGIMRGLWHLFAQVHLLPTVFLNGRWVYETVDDIINRAVRL